MLRQRPWLPPPESCSPLATSCTCLQYTASQKQNRVQRHLHSSGDGGPGKRTSGRQTRRSTRPGAVAWDWGAAHTQNVCLFEHDGIHCVGASGRIVLCPSSACAVQSHPKKKEKKARLGTRSAGSSRPISSGLITTTRTSLPSGPWRRPRSSWRSAGACCPCQPSGGRPKLSQKQDNSAFHY